MRDWPHSRVHSAALAHIRRSTMKEAEWLYTELDCLRESIGDDIQLENEEHPLVSFYLDSSNWWAMTTSRCIGVTSGARFSVNPVTATEWVWGNFKHEGRAELQTVRVTRHDGTSVDFLYETGYASMAPIRYQRFWKLKYPILHKLAV